MSSVPLEIEADVLGLDPLAPDEVCTLTGQATVAKTRSEVQRVRLVPDKPPARREAVDAIMAADSVVLGPGSWFTSVIPHLLVPDLAQAIVTTKAQRILVLNITSAAETDGFSAARHIELLAEHAPGLRLDVVVADTNFTEDDEHIEGYVQSLGGRLVRADVASHDGTATHDRHRLASVFSEVIAP